MKYSNLVPLLGFAVLSAFFLSGCASWQDDGRDSGYRDSGGHGGHGGHHYPRMSLLEADLLKKAVIPLEGVYRASCVSRIELKTYGPGKFSNKDRRFFRCFALNGITGTGPCRRMSANLKP